MELTEALEATTYLDKETEYLPWQSTLENFLLLHSLLKYKAAYGLFRVHMGKSAEQIYEMCS